MTEHDDRFEPCLGCFKPLDVTAPHISFERRREVQDPPGHVVEIGGAVGVVFHVECAPSLDALAGGAAGWRPASSSSPDDTARPLLEWAMAGIRMRAKTCRPCADFVDHLNAPEDPHAASAAVPDTAPASPVSKASGEPYGPGTVVDVIADVLDETIGMTMSWPRISGTAHRAAARLRQLGLLAGAVPVPADGGTEVELRREVELLRVEVAELRDAAAERERVDP